MKSISGKKPLGLSQSLIRLIDSFRIWLFHMILILLFFFVAGSIQELSDDNLFLLLECIRIAAYFYIVFTLIYQSMLFFVRPRRFFSRIRSLFGLLIVLLIYVGESYLLAWLGGI